MAAGDVITGSAMTLKIGATPVAANHVGKWSIVKKVSNAKYASNSTAGWKKSVVGTKDWSGSITVFLHDGAALEWSIEGAVVAAQFHVDGGGSDYYSGSIRIVEVSEEYDADTGDPVAVEITYEGDGALTANGTIIDV